MNGTADNRSRGCWTLVIIGMLSPVLARGQQPSLAPPEAAATITGATVTRHLAVLTADSMRDRRTPSQGLERAARYIAAEFTRLGLGPGSTERGGSSWLQTYPLPGQQQVDLAASVLDLRVVLQRHGKPVLTEVGWRRAIPHIRFDLATNAYLVSGEKTPGIAKEGKAFTDGRPMVVVAGRQTAAAVRQAIDQLQGRVVLYVPAAGATVADRRAVLGALTSVSDRVILVSPADSQEFAAAAAAARRPPPMMVDDYMREAAKTSRWPWTVAIRESSLRAQAFVDLVGLELAELQAASVPVVQELPSTISALLRLVPTRAEVATAMNVVAVVKGRDPALQRQYLVLSAHMDNLGGDQAMADNTAGMAVLLAAAEALSQSEGRPRRPVVLLATSGGAKQGRWGESFFASHGSSGIGISSRVVAHLNVNLPRPPAGDTVRIDGLGAVEVAPSVTWATALHPELGLTAVDGRDAASQLEEHIAFVRKGAPTLSLGLPSTERPAIASWEAVPVGRAADVLSRVARLTFYLGYALASEDALPRWRPEYREFLFDVLAEP